MPTQDPNIQGWLQDPKFNALPYEEKSAVLRGYFSKHVADDAFRKLPDMEQRDTSHNFVRAQIGDKPPEEPPTWGETLGKSIVAGAANVDQSLFRATKDIWDVSRNYLPSQFIGKLFNKQIAPESDEFVDKAFNAGIEWAKNISRQQSPAPELRKLPYWHPKRIAGTGLEAMPQVGAVIAGAVAGGPVGAATMLGTIAYGSSAEEAKEEGATKVQQVLHGLTSAEIEVLTEYPVISAVGRIWKTLKKSGVADDVALSFSKRLLKGLGMYSKATMGEGLQELEAYLGGQLSKRAFYDADAPITLKDAIEATYGGVAMGLTLGVIGAPAALTRMAGKPVQEAPPAPEEVTPTPDKETILAKIKTDLEAGDLSINELVQWAKDPEVQRMGIANELNEIIIEATGREETPIPLTEEVPPTKLPTPPTTGLLPPGQGFELVEKPFTPKTILRKKKGEAKGLIPGIEITPKESETDRLVRGAVEGRFGLTRPELPEESPAVKAQRELKELRTKIDRERILLKQQLERERAGALKETPPAEPTTPTPAPVTHEDRQEATKEVETIPEPTPKEKKKAKEPWEMTRNEFEKHAPSERMLSESLKISGKKPSLIVANKAKGKIYRGTKKDTHATLLDRKGLPYHETIAGYVDENNTFIYQFPEQAHKLEVQQALKEDKPVPQKVLDDYPDLKKAQRDKEEGVERVERRKNITERERVRKLIEEGKIEEVEDILYADSLTGLKNKRGWDVEERKPVQGMFDADGLKWFNDNIGYEAGDILLKKIGNAIKEATDFGARVGGDEYRFEADTVKKAQDIVDKVNKYMEENPLTVEMPNGEVRQYIGRLSHGIGESEQAAEKSLKRDRGRREETGERSKRGTEPKRFIPEKVAGKERTARVEGVPGEEAVGRGEGVEKPQQKAVVEKAEPTELGFIPSKSMRPKNTGYDSQIIGGFWTNGNIIEKKHEIPKWAIEGEKGESPMRLSEEEMKDRWTLFLGIKRKGIKATRIRGDLDRQHAILEGKGKITAEVDSGYIGYFKTNYQNPEFRFYVADKVPRIAIVQNGEVVGGIMGMRHVKLGDNTYIAPIGAPIGKPTKALRPSKTTTPKKIIDKSVWKALDKAEEAALDVPVYSTWEGQELLYKEEVRKHTAPTTIEGVPLPFKSDSQKVGYIEISSPTDKAWKYKIVNTKEAVRRLRKDLKKAVGVRLEEPTTPYTVHTTLREYAVTADKTALQKVAGVEAFEKEAHETKQKADQAIISIAKELEEGAIRRNIVPGEAVPDRPRAKGTVSESIAEYKDGIAQELLAKRRVDFTGRKLTKGYEAHEIAQIWQVYRSPKMEKLSLIYRDNAGVILSHNMITSGQLQYVNFGDAAKWLTKAKSTAKRLGATKIDIVHNHPSGNPVMSENDKDFGAYAKKFLGNLSGKFVVIDHGKFTHLVFGRRGYADRFGTYTVNPDHGNWIYKKKVKISGAFDAAAFAQTMNIPEGKIGIIYLDTGAHIQGWSTHNKSFFNRGIGKVRDSIQQQSSAHDAASAIIVMDNTGRFPAWTDNIGKVGDFLTDIIRVSPGQGPVRSLRGIRESAFGFPEERKSIRGRAVFEEQEGYKPTRSFKDYLDSLPEYAEFKEKIEKGQSFKERHKESRELLDKYAGRFSKGFPTRKDIRLYHKIFSLPFWLGKKFPSIGKLVTYEIEMQEEREKMLHQDYDGELGRIQEELGKDKETMKEFTSLIWRWDRRKFSEDDVPTKWHGDIIEGQDITINPKHYDEVRDYLAKKGNSKKAVDAFIAVRQILDQKYVDLEKTLRIEKVDPELIEEYRANIGMVNNYFPHRRTGNAHVTLVDKKTGETIYREHYNIFKDRFLPPGKKARDRAEQWITKKQRDIDDYKLIQEKVTELPDEVFYQIPIEAMQQIIDASGPKLEKARVRYEAERLLKKGEVSSEKEAYALARKRLRADLSAALSSAVSDTLKSRGFGRHAILSKGIPGHETEDVFGILFDYLSGYAGFKTKMKRARHHSEVLMDINAKKFPGEYKYASQYTKDVLANQDRLDRIVDTVRGLFFVKYLGFVVKSGIVNLTQNVVLGGPTLSVHTKGAHIKLGKASIDLRKFLTSKEAWQGKEIKTPSLAQNERDALHELVQSGAAMDLFLRELKGNIPGQGWGKHLNKFIDKSGIFMRIAERFNRSTIGLAAYRVGVNEKGMSHNEAIVFAKDIIYRSHFLYGKANLPELMRGGDIQRTMRTAYTFRTFTHNYLNAMAHLLTNQGPEGKKAFARSLRNVILVGGLSALPFFKALSEALTWVFDDDEDPLTVARSLMPWEWIKDLITYGLPGVAGYDLTGSLSIEFPRNWADIIGIPYAVGEDIVNMKHSIEAGQKWRAVSETPFTPIVARNAMRGLELYVSGQRTRSGRDINYPGEVGARKISGIEAVGKSIAGMQPTSVSKGYGAYRAISKMERWVNRKKSQWANQYVNAYRAGNQKEVDRVIAEMQKWNDLAEKKNKPERMINLGPAIKFRLRPMDRQIPRRMRQRALEISKEWGVK